MIDRCGWNHDMSEAPRDGTKIQLWCGVFGMVRMGYFRDGHFWTGDIVCQPSARETDPTKGPFVAWRPLPEPPVTP